MWQRQAIRHGGTFLKHIVPAIIKPLHALWNEVIGFLFLSFATIFGIRTYTYYKVFAQAPPTTAGGEFARVLITAIVAVVMACFGISSFRRARKISRS